MAPVVCKSCGSDKFRTSHFRLGDIPQLLLLRRPVRCRVCDGRIYVPITQAGKYKSHHGKKAG